MSAEGTPPSSDGSEATLSFSASGALSSAVIGGAQEKMEGQAGAETEDMREKEGQMGAENEDFQEKNEGQVDAENYGAINKGQEDLPLQTPEKRPSQPTSDFTNCVSPKSQTYPENISIFVGTWNVGNSVPQQNLETWLPPSSAKHAIVAIGAQECSYTPKSSRYPTCASDWEALLCSHLRRFVICKSVALGEMRLIVFVRKRYAKFIKHIDSGSAATGIANMLGNKGGLAVSFHFGDLRLGFVSCHLAAHQNQTARRNMDARNIAGIRVGKWSMDLCNQFHHLFWFGDLNYRLDWGDQGDALSPSPEQFITMVDMVQEKRFEELFQVDQLKKQQRLKTAFQDFEEGAYEFPPTFKKMKVKDRFTKHATSADTFALDAAVASLWRAPQERKSAPTHKRSVTSPSAIHAIHVHEPPTVHHKPPIIHNRVSSQPEHTKDDFNWNVDKLDTRSRKPSRWKAFTAKAKGMLKIEKETPSQGISISSPFVTTASSTKDIAVGAQCEVREKNTLSAEVKFGEKQLHRPVEQTGTVAEAVKTETQTDLFETKAVEDWTVVNSGDGETAEGEASSVPVDNISDIFPPAVRNSSTSVPPHDQGGVTGLAEVSKKISTAKGNKLKSYKGYSAKRSPAWTDRILWKSMSGLLFVSCSCILHPFYLLSFAF
mmetsp:Transcript_24156/g.47501  ORF Transcript_24156/g.47501 Transcript_24156/m.47501 type:complete len:659 (+) Transcript_24156:84-2060(+)